MLLHETEVDPPWSGLIPNLTFLLFLKIATALVESVVVSGQRFSNCEVRLHKRGLLCCALCEEGEIRGKDTVKETGAW